VLAFLDYDEETALRSIEPLGWERPQDTDPNSTNCLLKRRAEMKVLCVPTTPSHTHPLPHSRRGA